MSEARRLRLKIVADGHAWHTRLFDAETGVELSAAVKVVEFLHVAGQLPQVRLTLADAILELEGEWIKRPPRERLPPGDEEPGP